MQCIHCKAWNEEDERRCLRCGRRLHLSAPRSAPDVYPSQEATARVLDVLPGGRTWPAEIPQPERAQQPWLFKESLTSQNFPSPKVVPIPLLTPRPQSAERKTPRTPGAGSRTPRRGNDSQQSLDFHNDTAAQERLSTEVEAVIYCDAPVALPVHRLMAAAVDASMIAIAAGAFAAIFYLSGARIAFTPQTALLMVGVIAVIALFYRVLWALGNGDTPGMHFAGLRLVNFDGRAPGREQRGIRQAASVLSLLSAGLGLVWALVDEENLTWHDHISKTFPTPG